MVSIDSQNVQNYRNCVLLSCFLNQMLYQLPLEIQVSRTVVDLLQQLVLCHVRPSARLKFHYLVVDLEKQIVPKRISHVLDLSRGNLSKSLPRKSAIFLEHQLAPRDSCSELCSILIAPLLIGPHVLQQGERFLVKPIVDLLRSFFQNILDDGLIVGGLINEQSRLHELVNFGEIVAHNVVEHIALVDQEQGWNLFNLKASCQLRTVVNVEFDHPELAIVLFCMLFEHRRELLTRLTPISIAIQYDRH